jgi:hypothetical protein
MGLHHGRASLWADPGPPSASDPIIGVSVAVLRALPGQDERLDPRCSASVSATL